jgi:hypothetical protein
VYSSDFLGLKLQFELYDKRLKHFGHTKEQGHAEAPAADDDGLHPTTTTKMACTRRRQWPAPNNNDNDGVGLHP